MSGETEGVVTEMPLDLALGPRTICSVHGCLPCKLVAVCLSPPGASPDGDGFLLPPPPLRGAPQLLSLIFCTYIASCMTRTQSTYLCRPPLTGKALKQKHMKISIQLG